MLAAASIGFASDHLVGENARAFEGRICGTFTRDNQPEEWLYTVGRNFLRVESAVTNGKSPVDILNRSSGELTLIFPHNRSFIHLKAVTHPGPGPETQTPQLPPGIGPQSESRTAVPTAAPGSPRPFMPPVVLEKLEFRDRNEKTNILGYECEHFEIRQRGKAMDIWATSALGAFEPYARSQPLSAHDGTIDDQWAELLKARHLFPLLAILKLENGLERLRFEVTSIAPQSVTDEDPALFQPPADYHEALPLPF